MLGFGSLVPLIIAAVLCVFLIGLLFFVIRGLKKNSERQAAKYLANPVRAGEYAVSKGISEEDVYRLVREGKLEGYSFKKQFYVSDT